MVVVCHFKCDDTIEAVSKSLDVTPGALSSCKVAGIDLNVFPTITKDIDSPGDLYERVRDCH